MVPRDADFVSNQKLYFFSSARCMALQHHLLVVVLSAEVIYVIQGLEITWGIYVVLLHQLVG